MHRIDTDGNVSGLFTEGNPATGQVATVVGADWLNYTVQEELVNVVLSENITLDKNDDTQLLQAISLKTGSAIGLQMESDTPLNWDGSKIEFDSDITIKYRTGAAGAFFESVIQTTEPPVTGELTLADGEVVVMRKNNSVSSPLNLSYQANYANLQAGEFAIVAESSLVADNIGDEIILFRHHDEAPTYHYGVDQKILDVVPYGHRIYHESKFNLGSDKNLLREENTLFSQAAINGNMTVSQRGNFTTAITSATGLAFNFQLDRWKLSGGGAFLANASFQRSSPSIAGHNELTNAMKIVCNSSGSPISGKATIRQAVEDYAAFAGKTITISLWLRSNITNDLRIRFDDGVTDDYTSEIDTNSGDEVWRHYTITKTVDANPTEMQFGVYQIDADGITSVTIPAGGYFEFTGVRLYVGSDDLPALIRSYDEELGKCQRYFYGCENGEFAFNPGYSIYNINGVNRTTWRSSNADGFSWLKDSITDVGSVGQSEYELIKNMALENSVTRNVYIFDNESVPTQGGSGANQKATTQDSSGTVNHAVSVTGDFFGSKMIAITQSSLLGVGTLTALMHCESEIF